VDGRKLQSVRDLDTTDVEVVVVDFVAQKGIAHGSAAYDRFAEAKPLSAGEDGRQLLEETWIVEFNRAHSAPEMKIEELRQKKFHSITSCSRFPEVFTGFYSRLGNLAFY
jgi:hypothetical protein